MNREVVKKMMAWMLVLAIFGYYFVFPFSIKKSDAVLGVADQTFNTTVLDIPRILFQIGTKIVNVFFQQLRRRFITMLQNDLVNWVQGGGRPRFVTDPKKFLKQTADQAAVSALDEFFRAKGADICSGFSGSLRLMVERSVFLPERQARCTLGQIKDNLVGFKDNFSKGGGWKTWIALHETSNTLPGTYLAALETVSLNTNRTENSAAAQITAGKGFLDQKTCLIYQIKVSSEELLTGGDYAALSPEQREQFAAFGYVTEDVKVPNPNGIPMSEIPQNATCIDDKTITPGSVIGDQISGSLKSTGIDKLVNAKEISEIIDAVIDAGVNRVAREGLSMVKSGRGSYTKPVRAQTRLAKTAALDPNRGSEGAVGVELLNKVVAYKTKTEKLINTLATLVVDRTVSSDKKVLAEGNKGGGLLKKIGLGHVGGLAATIVGGPVIIGVGSALYAAKDRKGLEYLFSPDAEKKLAQKENLSQVDVLEGRLNYIFEKVGSIKCSEKEKTAGKIERCFFYGNAINFNEEDNNPGPLAANKLLHKKMAEKWGELVKTLTVLKGRGDLISSCKVPDIRYTLDPDEPDLPFTAGDGTTFEWTKDEYPKAIDTNKVAGTEAQNWKDTYLDLDAISNAEIQREQNQSMVETYNQLISNANATIESLRQDVDFAINASQNIILYAGILMDFDKAGREFKLADAYKKYTEALNKGDTETALTVRNGELFFKFAETTNEWVKIQNDIINSKDSNTGLEEKDKATSKLKIINEALRIITKSFQAPEGTPGEVAETKSIIADDPNQIWTSPSEAVSQAMINLKITNQSMDQVTNELDARDARITRLSSDISNQIGRFPTNKEERVQLGLDGGDSEWEKYFKNRQQFVYLSMINDFYKKYIACQK